MTGFMRRTFVLDFEDPSFNGLEVRTRSASLGTLMRMQELMGMALGDGEHVTEREEFFYHLADSVLISWNLLDEQGVPVKISPESLAEEEWPMIRQIARAWVRAVTSVAPPLSNSSSDGDQSEEPQLPYIQMETMPPSSTAEPATIGESPVPTMPDGSPKPNPWSWTNPPSSNEQSGL